MKETQYTILLENENKIYKAIKSGELKRFNPERTAITRKTASLPVRLAYKSDKNIFKNKIVLDFGKGKSNDCKYIIKKGGICYIYDFTYCPLLKEARDYSNEKIRRISPNIMVEKFDIIICSYVLNVVTPIERQYISETLKRLLAEDGKLIIGVREDIESINKSWRRYKDGYITTKNTFQTFFHPKKGGKAKLDSLFPEMMKKKIGRGTWILKFK